MAPLTVHGRTWDPDDGAGGDSSPWPVPTDSRYIIVQGAALLSSEEKRRLESGGVAIDAYVDTNTYLCRLEQAQKQADLQWLRDRPSIRATDLLPPCLKVAGSLALAATGEPGSSSRRRIAIGLHQGASVGLRDLADDLVRRGWIVAADTVVLGNHVETVVEEPQRIADIAGVDDVRRIDEVLPETSHISVARGLMNCPAAAVQPLAADGTVGVMTAMDGRGQVINIVDTGFDKGVCDVSAREPADHHPAFAGRRCLDIYTFAQEEADKSKASSGDYERGASKGAEDTDGHGTHVAGCAVADGTTKTMGGVGANREGAVRGTAPGARFTVTQNSSVKGKIQSRDMEHFVGFAYRDHGCRISNHSYGPGELPTNGLPLPYGVYNEDTDGHLCAHPDLVVTWAAGNTGLLPTAEPARYGQIQGRPASKNVITVGSSLSARALDDYAFSPGKAQADAYKVAQSSARGLTFEGRLKPDLCAPGRTILSALSRVAADNGSFGKSSDGHYKWDSGTSMAAPAVAGCAAVLRQALTERRVSSPSGALIKALLVNGAVDIMRQPGKPPQIPNRTQGFGRVNVESSLRMIVAATAPSHPDDGASELGPAGFLDVNDQNPTYKPIRDGAIHTFPPLMVPHGEAVASWSETSSPPPPGLDRITNGHERLVPSQTLKVTLTWYDQPHSLIQDGLGLAVTAGPQMERRHGNKGETNLAGAEMTIDSFDPVNNTQLVLWEGVAAGPVTIQVVCKTTQPGREVAYALAWSLE